MFIWMFFIFLMKRRPPISNRSYTLLPYTTLVRSRHRSGAARSRRAGLAAIRFRSRVDPVRSAAYRARRHRGGLQSAVDEAGARLRRGAIAVRLDRSEEHTSELQYLMRISYAVFCLKKKKKIKLHRNLY